MLEKSPVLASYLEIQKSIHQQWAAMANSQQALWEGWHGQALAVAIDRYYAF